MAKRVFREVVRNVVRDQRPSRTRSRSEAARAPRYLVKRRKVYFFQVRLPQDLIPANQPPGEGAVAPCRNAAQPLRIRLGVLPRQHAQWIALTLAGVAQGSFERWRRKMNTQEAGLPDNYDPHVVGEIGFPRGDSPEENIANLMTYLKDTAAKLAGGPPRERLTPSILRWRAAFQEAVGIEQEVGKGEAANPIIVHRADMLREDVWARWRAGEHGGSPEAPLTQAISKLADVADRQLAIMSGQAQNEAIHERTLVDRVHPPVARHDPSVVEKSSEEIVAVSQAPLFSEIMEEYLKMRNEAGAAGGAVSTMRLRAKIFTELMGDLPFDTYRPKDLQDYVNLLQYLPLEYTRDGKEHAALQHMSPRWLIDRNKQHRCWEPLSIKTMQDGYVQVVKTIVSEAVMNYRLENPFARARIRWPDNAKPSVKREALDHDKLDKAFGLGVASGYLDDAMIPPICYLSTRRIGIIPWIRGCDFDRKHGVDIVRVNGIVFDKARGIYRRVGYKTDGSLRFFVLHRFFRENGFIDWAVAQGDNFIFRQLHTVTDPSDTASKHVNRLLKRAGAVGMNIEVGHSIRHGGKDLLIEEDVDTSATRLQMGHEPSDVHANYGERDELRRKQCQELANFDLPKAIDWSRFKGLDFEAMARKPRGVGRPKRK
jgi:hypothetical protein